MTGYRQVLAVPGMTPLLSVSLLARTAITADVMALTMYVVLGLHLSYAAAGGVAAALTAGLAVGGPVAGRMIDRRGVRVVLLATGAAQVMFWASVPVLPYGILVAAAFAAGLGMVPVQLVTRQAIAAMTAPGQRRAAFALESVQGELSYMLGPAAVIVGAAKASPGVVAWAVGAVIAGGGAGIAVLNPPLHGVGEVDARSDTPAGPGSETGAGARVGGGVAVETAGRPSRRQWLGSAMIAVLTMAFGTTTLLAAVDLAIVATLRQAGQVSWAAVVVAEFGVASVSGGLIYGTLPRPLPTWLLLGLLGLATVPASLAHTWQWLCVTVVAIGLLTAPTLSAIADAVSRLAPPAVRGEATGLQSSALSAGFAIGSPAAGVAIDATTPAGGFVAAALASTAAALVGWLLARRAPAQVRVVLDGHDADAGVDAFGGLSEVPELELCDAGTQAGV